MRFCQHPECSKKTLKDNLLCPAHQSDTPFTKALIEEITKSYLEEDAADKYDDLQEKIQTLESELEEIKTYL